MSDSFTDIVEDSAMGHIASRTHMIEGAGGMAPIDILLFESRHNIKYGSILPTLPASSYFYTQENKDEVVGFA